MCHVATGSRNGVGLCGGAMVAMGSRVRVGAMDVEAVYLMRSDLSPAGARYTELATVPLAAAAEAAT